MHASSTLAVVAALLSVGCTSTSGSAASGSAPLARETQAPSATTPGATPCQEMPAQRPQGAHLRYTRRGGDPMDLLRVRLVATGDECPADEIPAYLRPAPPTPVCVSVDPLRLDALWAELFRAGLPGVRTRTTQAGPHRGGRSLGAVWPDGRCDVSDIRDSEVVEATAQTFTELVTRVQGEIDDARRRAAEPLRFVAPLSMRTSSRPPRLTLRADNHGTEMQRVRLHAMAAMDEAGQPGDALALRALHVSTVPFEDVYPSTATHESALDAWFEVPAGESRVLEIEPDDHPPYSFGSHHGYRVTLEREAGSEQSLDLVLDDAIRHPLRR